MVLFTLEVKADLENIERLELPEGYSYCINVKNSAGFGEREGVYVSAMNEEDLVNSRGTCNFQLKWERDARNSAHLFVLEEVKGVTKRSITAENSGSFVPLLGLDCRGLEPVKFHVENGWTAESTGGTTYEDVDLRDDWAEYCEKIGESVGIYAVEARFVRR